MDWTWLGIAVAVFVVFSCYMGFRRGFVREVVSLFCVVLSMAVVWFINPYVNQFICENTSVCENIQESCKNMVAQKGKEEIHPDREQQEDILESLNLPGFLVDDLEINNTAEMYRYLAVETFTDYVSGYLSRVAVNGISFLVSFVLATLLIRMITWALNLIAGLPVIKGANKLAGGVLGAAKAVIFIWVAFPVLTILCNTEVGKTGLEMIERDSILSWLYEKDIFIDIFMNIFYGVKV